MSGRKKVLRKAVTIIGIYIILNVLIYGTMTAYMNTRNTINEDKLTMAQVSEEGEQTSIKILGREYSMDIDGDTENTAIAALYCIVPGKVRACAELLLHLRGYFFG